MRLKLIITLGLLFLYKFMYAGWFICYTYKGHIGERQVLMNIQIEKRYSTTRSATLNINGVYTIISNGVSSPFVLSGTFNEGTKKIYLRGNDRESDFSLSIIGNQLTGIDTKTKEKIRLIKTGSLIDTTYDSERKVTGVRVLQEAHIHRFIIEGVYSIYPLQDAKMDSLLLIDKTNGSIYQTIDLSGVDFPAGNLVTNIFQNVEVMDKNKDGYEDILIWVRSGKRGGYVCAYFDPISKKYKLNPDAKVIERQYPR